MEEYVHNNYFKELIACKERIFELDREMENYRYLESLDEEFFFTNYQFNLPI